MHACLCITLELQQPRLCASPIYALFQDKASCAMLAWADLHVRAREGASTGSRHGGAAHGSGAAAGRHGTRVAAASPWA